jgi:hypothetical protein
MEAMNDDVPEHDDMDEDRPVQQARLWQANGWTARVIKNEDDEGWAVAMIKDGEPEPALVGPWTMGRDKKNPKPLDVNAFHTLVKTANEVLRRHEQQRHAMLHKSTVVSTGNGELKVTLDIIPDDDDPYAWLTATDEMGGWRRPSSCRRPRPTAGSRTTSVRRAENHNPRRCCWPSGRLT